MSTIEAAYPLLDGPNDSPLVYVRGVGYRPGQEVPIEDPWGVPLDGQASDKSKIETVQDPDLLLRRIGKGPTRSELVT